MKPKRSIWTTLTGGFTSAAPILLSCCKSGACVGVCASPIASLFGISSATMASSPWMSVVEPVLIAISAVSFTISYYSLYVLPKFNCNTDGSCDRAPTDKEKRRTKLNKFVFWFGLIASIGFLSYFEVTKYQAATFQQECSTECAPGECSTNAKENYIPACDSTSSCCSEESESKLSMSSEITCPKCGYKKTEVLPTQQCLLSYTCKKCNSSFHPKDGDCCVFCSYGDHKCPSKQ